MIDLEGDVRGFAGEAGSGDISRFYFFSLAFDQIRKEGLQGDFAELGVYRGRTATLLARMARRLGRTAYLLDTFEGFNVADCRGIDAGQKMQFADTSLESVRALVGEENVRYVQGYFPDSAAQLPDAQYCMVHIDCDLYAPIYSALEYFYPRLVPGGFLIVHDYSSLSWDGAERAVDEFFTDRAESIIPLTDGAGSVVVRKTRDPKQQPGWLTRKRRALFSEDWSDAGEGRLSELLGEGWSDAEPWGVWGIGDMHEMRLALPSGVTGGCFLEAEVRLSLPADIECRSVDVLIEGRMLETWQFTKAANHAVRSVRIPDDLLRDDGPGSFRVVFRPHGTVRPVNFDPASKDKRALGMALHRIRRRLG
jgi:Macrocin-O-methyltransferase (TylF)